MVIGWCTTAEAVVYERARPLKRPEEGGSGLKRAERPEEGGSRLKWAEGPEEGGGA